ncbi:MAG: hypothetical protein ACRD4Y_14960 [Candidatus Acidiferrales bacterium]
MRLRGSLRLLFLYDVAEAIDLPILRGLLGARGGPVERLFPRRTPQYVRFEHPPIVEPLEPLALSADTTAACSIKYYGFGAVVVQAEIGFDCEWQLLLEQNSRWMDADDVEKQIRQAVHQHLERVESAVIRPTADWLQETYLVTELQEILDAQGQESTAADLLASHGNEIVQLVRGEKSPLSPKACEETLEAGLSYFPQDLVVVGSYAALVCDGAEGATATMQVLEYAKMQLLEFRYYDRLMTNLLAEFYDVLNRKRNVLLSRWKLPREAQRFNTVRLDVMELTEQIDNAIKFVSDIYFARVYRLAARRIGVPDYRTLVEEKLATAGDLYDFMVDQFNEARSFVVEVAIAVLAAMDVIFLFRWK